jgi:hypothetical protein
MDLVTASGEVLDNTGPDEAAATGHQYARHKKP